MAPSLQLYTLYCLMRISEVNNFMGYDYINIDTKTSLGGKKEKSAVIKCISSKNEDIQLFSSWIKKEIISSTIQVGIENIVDSRITKILEWRHFLDTTFIENEEDKRYCIDVLAHLILAKYSGKAQSYNAIGYTLSKLANAISQKLPIIFTFCFGGYKSHQSISYPEVDWAEMFNLNYLFSYLYPIITSYKHGVELEFESEEIVVQFNNVPQKGTDKYTSTFRKLLEYYSVNIAKKFDIRIPVRLEIARERYTKNEVLYHLMDDERPRLESVFNSLPTDIQGIWLKRAESNFMWNGGTTDYSNCSETEKYDLVKNARITNECFLVADYILREDFFEQQNRIPLTGTWGRMPSDSPIDGWLHIKSTTASLVDFWIGTGILEIQKSENGEKYIENIYSSSQYNAFAKSISLVRINDDELESISNNFCSVPVNKQM
jgi:hypothetical protein